MLRRALKVQFSSRAPCHTSTWFLPVYRGIPGFQKTLQKSCSKRTEKSLPLLRAPTRRMPICLESGSHDARVQGRGGCLRGSFPSAAPPAFCSCSFVMPGMVWSPKSWANVPSFFQLSSIASKLNLVTVTQTKTRYLVFSYKVKSKENILLLPSVTILLVTCSRLFTHH